MEPSRRAQIGYLGGLNSPKRIYTVFNLPLKFSGTNTIGGVYLLSPKWGGQVSAAIGTLSLASMEEAKTAETPCSRVPGVGPRGFEGQYMWPPGQHESGQYQEEAECFGGK